MKNVKGKLVVNIKLPKNFIEDIKQTINDEIRISQKKWKVSLTLQEKEVIFTKALEQLKSKTLNIFGKEWDFTDKVIIFVNSHSYNEITLPNKKSKQHFIRQGQSWSVDNDGLDYINTISAQDFPAEIEKLLKEWSKTAAFYGVGSFS